MKNPHLWLAVMCVAGVVVYALWHPGPDSLSMLKEVSVGVIVGKFALEVPRHGSSS